MTHVLDPPPESLVIPWGYLALLAMALVVATTIAVIGAVVMGRRSGIDVLRAL